MEYLLRADELKRAAIDVGVTPTGRAIGIACGLPASTVNWALNGRPPSNHTMAALSYYLGVPFDTLFERQGTS